MTSTFKLIPDDILFNYQNMKNNTNIVNSSYDMAMTMIPEMSCPVNLIIIKGKINNKPVTLMLDTGASVSIISLEAINRLRLTEYVDYETKSKFQGIGNEISPGTLWYIELNLNDNIFPVTLFTTNNKQFNFDIILGVNFLKSYNAEINLKNHKIKLNDKYDISFDN